MKNTKTTNILLIVIIVILLAPILLLSLVFSSSNYQMAKNPIPSATPRTVTVKQIADMIDNSCSQIWGSSFESELNEETELYTVKTWMNYIDDEAIERTKAGENQDEWDSMATNLKETANTMQKAFNDNDHSEVTVVLSICDPEDHSEEYLTIANGIIGIDVVNEIDLRKSP